MLERAARQLISRFTFLWDSMGGARIRHGLSCRGERTGRPERVWVTSTSTTQTSLALWQWRVLHIDGGVGSAYDLSRNTRGSHQAMVYSRRTLFYYFTCIEHRELKRSEFINLPHSIAVIFLKNFSRVFSHGVAAILDLLFRVRYI